MTVKQRILSAVLLSLGVCVGVLPLVQSHARSLHGEVTHKSNPATWLGIRTLRRLVRRANSPASPSCCSSCWENSTINSVERTPVWREPCCSPMPPSHRSSTTTLNPLGSPFARCPSSHVDFGGGTTVTRTLHGNIATYVCNAEGNVLDILPGAYDADTYLAQLQQLTLLSNQIVDAEESFEELRAYHIGKLAMGSDETRIRIAPTSQPTVAKQRIADFSKFAVIEQPIEAVLKSEPDSSHAEDASTATGMNDKTLANLAQDTSYNETHRRRQIHEHLARANWTAPQSLTKWLYREVLNSDLDDPYLGMKDLLFSNYPFIEDAR